MRAASLLARLLLAATRAGGQTGLRQSRFGENRRMGKRRAAAALFGLALSAAAAAHDTWLLRSGGGRTAGATVRRLNLTSGGAFPARESPIDPERIAVAEVRQGAGPRPIAARVPRRKALELSFPLEGAGVATVAVSLKPRALVLEDSKIDEYLDEIGARETAGAIWQKMPGPKRWHEIYSKHAKTHVRAEGSSGDDSWKEPAGLALEIVAERDPTRLSSGDSLPVRVLRKGAPLPGFSLRADPGPKGTTSRRTTDADGRAAFVLDRSGPWLLAGTDLRWDADARVWRSDFTTLTVEVATPARR